MSKLETIKPSNQILNEIKEEENSNDEDYSNSSSEGSQSNSSIEDFVEE